MRLIRRLTVTTLTRRSIRVIDPLPAICPVCGSELVTIGSANTPACPSDNREVASLIDGRVNTIPGAKELGKKE
jgi:hypothetical protein